MLPLVARMDMESFRHPESVTKMFMCGKYSRVHRIDAPIPNAEQTCTEPREIQTARGSWSSACAERRAGLRRADTSVLTCCNCPGFDC